MQKVRFLVWGLRERERERKRKGKEKGRLKLKLGVTFAEGTRFDSQLGRLAIFFRFCQRKGDGLVFGDRQPSSEYVGVIFLSSLHKKRSIWRLSMRKSIRNWESYGCAKSGKSTVGVSVGGCAVLDCAPCMLHWLGKTPWSNDAMKGQTFDSWEKELPCCCTDSLRPCFVIYHTEHKFAFALIFLALEQRLWWVFTIRSGTARPSKVCLSPWLTQQFLSYGQLKHFGRFPGEFVCSQKFLNKLCVHTNFHNKRKHLPNKGLWNI